MKTILKDLKPGDIFNMVTFSSDVSQWKPESLQVSTHQNIVEATNFIDAIKADGGEFLSLKLLLFWPQLCLLL